MGTVEAFNKQLMGLSQDLHKLVPSDKRIERVQTNLEWYIQISPEGPLSYFKTYAYDHYMWKILDKDEEFFLNLDYSDIKDKASAMTNENDPIGLIKEYWRELTDENKEKIWKYLRNLIKLCHKYVQENQ